LGVIAASGLPSRYLKGVQYRLPKLIKLKACAGVERGTIVAGARRIEAVAYSGTTSAESPNFARAMPQASSPGEQARHTSGRTA
jgi:hypothetical protein